MVSGQGWPDIRGLGAVRRTARIDENQPALVALARKLGASVWITSSLGKGAPDVVLGLPSGNVLVEIKDGSKPPSRRQLTPDEQEFHAKWRGPIAVVETADDMMKLVQGESACSR